MLPFKLGLFVFLLIRQGLSSRFEVFLLGSLAFGFDFVFDSFLLDRLGLALLGLLLDTVVHPVHGLPDRRCQKSLELDGRTEFIGQRLSRLSTGRFPCLVLRCEESFAKSTL